MTYWTDLLGRSFTVEQIDAKGTDTRALVMGAGEPVILLHGISGHLETFIPAAARFAGYELHLIDMLGHGFTAKPGGALTIDRLAGHVIDYMDARGIARAHIVGISLGGWVTGWMAIHHADRMLSGIMVAAAGNPAINSVAVSEHVRKSTLAGVMSDDRVDTQKRLQNVVLRPESADDELIDVRYAIYHLPEFRANIDGLLALTDVDIYNRYALQPEALRTVDVPMLLVWGEDDARSGVADAQFLVDNLNATKLIQMKDTGHWPPYERPADFVALATAFFRDGLDAVAAGRR